uniref:ATP synthase F0 subunit 8 n=1 Tax=Vema ewingi TaxID=1930079 RepID=A0A1L6BZV5_9MOLL|nr:ATP synthase F0 subunit 8 [Vema ewingi]APQ42944.1 ATP synthase F0 subunit 8 [Vema ewingi]
MFSMPQLSPLSWLFLFVLFWSTLFSFLCLLWWGSGYDLEKEIVSGTEDWEGGNVWNWG